MESNLGLYFIFIILEGVLFVSDYTVRYFGSIERDSDYEPKVQLESSFADAIGNLVFEVNEDFIPPLSYRKGAFGAVSFKDADKNKKLVGINEYASIMLSQKNIIVTAANDEVVAFMSFRHDYEQRDYLPQDVRAEDKVNYITTIAVSPDWQGKGICSNMYDYMEKMLPESVHANVVATRTWPQNQGHIKILERRKYHLVCTLHGEREFEGTLYDTIYYSKRVVRKQKSPRRAYYGL